MKILRLIFWGIIIITGFLFLGACEKEKVIKEKALPIPPHLIFVINTDSSIFRLDSIGQIALLPAGHRAQSPRMNKFFVHYIELARDFDSLGQGKVIFKADETTAGGNPSIDFSKAVLTANNQMAFSLPLTKIPLGTYKWLRLGVAYQNFDIKIKQGASHGVATYGSFLSSSVFVNTCKLKTLSLSPTAGAGNIGCGYYMIEQRVGGNISGAEGKLTDTLITQVNPMPYSPVPKGKGIITCAFGSALGQLMPLTIDWNSSKNLVIRIKLSTNQSFEWKESGNDNWFEPDAGDTLKDIGFRGMEAAWKLE